MCSSAAVMVALEAAAVAEVEVAMEAKEGKAVTEMGEKEAAVEAEAAEAMVEGAPHSYCLE